MKGRYDRDQKLKEDAQQVKFDKSGWIQKPAPEVTTQFTTVNSNELVMCPFCLYTAKLSHFFVSTNKGISQGKAQCPECHNGMMMKSLYNDWDAKEYAEWVFGYRRSGFWGKCPFATWGKRLKRIGWSWQFWARYKELKGSDDSDSYFEHMDKASEEWIAEQTKQYEEDMQRQEQQDSASTAENQQ